MTTEREILKLALEALKTVRHKIDSYQVNVCDDVDEAINAAEKVLAQPEQEPFCYVNVNAQGDVTRTMKRKDSWCKTPLYTTPPQRTWIGLTDEERDDIILNSTSKNKAVAKTEAKLKEKNT